MVKIRAFLERVTFCNPQNGYTVAKVKISGQKELVTVLGTMASPLPGQVLELEGEWVRHPKYGEQFKAHNCHCAVPASVNGIQKYLGSGLIKGIGPVMAKRIVREFAEKSLDIIEEDVQQLTKVQGIGPKRIEMISSAWQEQKEIRAVMLFLQSHNVSSTHATKIFKTYGQESIEVVQENPFRLAMDIFGIGFKTADTIAAKLGFKKDSALRIQAGIIYVLHQLSGEGHVYYPLQKLLYESCEILEVEKEVLEEPLQSLTQDRRIVLENLPGQSLDADRAVYLAKYHLCETRTAARLLQILRSPASLRPIDAQKALDWVQKKYALTLADKQCQAVRLALEQKVMVITGGPGTGKSFLLKALLRVWQAAGARVLLTAPTGRAAKRMQDASGVKAKTVHRLLEFAPGQGEFKKNENQPLCCNVLVLDEASMLDTLLAYHLLKALPDGATLILIGDVDQLPSVGAGNVLQDIIASEVVPVVHLNEIFRQARESSIVISAHNINQGKFPVLKPAKDKLDDFYFIQEDDQEKVLEMMRRMISERIPERFNLDPISQIQVLSPMNKGLVGVFNLNQELQKWLNPNAKELKRGTRIYRVGDKVMQIRNNYEKEVFNGDIGTIQALDRECQEVRIEVDGRMLVYEYHELDELVIAYAVSIHKAQGSDYDAVVIPLLTQHYIMLKRNLIYTAVTRGRKLVVIIGSKKALGMAINNASSTKRYTALSQRLGQGDG